MARSPQALRNDFATTANAFVRGHDWSALRLAEARKIVHAAITDRRERLKLYQADVRHVVDSFVDLIKTQPAFDPEDAVDVFRDQELDFIKDRAEFRGAVDKAIKAASRTPDNEALIILNEIKRDYGKVFEEGARINRDARWEVMAVRAVHRPSAGVGVIHGSNEPAA